MAVIVCIILVVVLAIAIARYLLLKRELRRMAAGIQQIRAQKSNRQLIAASGDKDALRLLGAVNSLYGDVWEERAAHRRELDKLQKSMADISHDLRTPLTALSGYIGLLAKPGNTPVQQAGYLATAQSKAKGLTRLVDMLFEYARLQTGEYPFSLAPVELNAALAGSLAGLYSQFQQAGQAPDVKLEQSPLYILADGQALERVFTNLLGNALAHGGGEIQVKCFAAGGKGCVQVANLAPSLDAGDVARLFDRSFVANRARTGQSAGLGLAIVQELVQGMGGSAAAVLEGETLTITVQWPLCG